MPITTDSRKDIVRRSFAAMAAGGVDEFAALMHPGFFNHEQAGEPPETRGPEPEQALGVARWLRAAFSDLSWQEHAVVADGDLVVVHATMAGRHTGDFAGYDRDGHVAQAFAPTGRPFATTQSHWHRLSDGLIAEHWANRDDLGTAEQLGWVPPSSAYLLRCAAAKRRARRAAGPARPAEERPFGPWRGELDEAKESALLALEAMRGGPLELFERAYHPEAYNREQLSEPPETRGRGPATFLATSRWLNAAFADLSWVVHHVVSEGDLVAVHMTMSGRHVAPMAFYDDDARVRTVFPPTGRSFAVTQTHWMRLAGDGRVIEHWANRDDLGMATQLGWIPPSPRMLARMALAKRRAR